MLTAMKRILLWCLIFALTVPSNYAQIASASYKITSRQINERPVNPLIYGNFIELGLGRQIEGLWAEKLYNASFEEVPPLKANLWDWFGKTAADNLSKEKWWHSGYEINDWYTWPASDEVRYGINRYWNFHHGLQAAVLDNGQKTGKAFMAQNGIWIKSGVKYIFRGYFSNTRTADPASNPVKVTIGLYPEKKMDKAISEKTISVPDGIYREFSVELDPGSFTGKTTFAVSVEPGTKVAIDGFSLMPVNSERGWRPETVEALKKIHVPMIRFPGGCFASFYDWREGVGPRLDRQPVVSEYWGGIEENHVGTVEFVELCRMIGAEPFLCVNILTGTADRAADWVSYCNGSKESGLGALRKQHGYPDLLKVKYWELDNEAYRRFGWEEYARRCVEYSKAMKSVDPDIKLVMVGYWKFNNNLKEMLEIAGKYIDVITDRAIIENELNHDVAIINEYNRQNGTHITLSNTEWLAPLDWSESSLDALNMQKSPNQMTLQEHEISWNYAMNAARQLLLFQRLGGDFEFASFNNLANTWGQNIIECTKDTVFISPAGKVFELMSRSPLRWVLKTDTLQNLSGVYVQAGLSKSIHLTPNPSPALAASIHLTPNPYPALAALTGEGSPKLIIYLLNYRSDSPNMKLDLKEFVVDPNSVKIRTVSGDGPLCSNSYQNTNGIKTTEKSIKIKNAKNPTFKLLPWSVTEITLTLIQ
jgi:alpha-L-arabinofuranosidase